MLCSDHSEKFRQIHFSILNGTFVNFFENSCLTLSIIRYGSRVKWKNPEKGVAPSPTPWCCSYRKGSLRVTLDYGRQLYLLYIYIYILDETDCISQSTNTLGKGRNPIILPPAMGK